MYEKSVCICVAKPEPHHFDGAGAVTDAAPSITMMFNIKMLFLILD
jgi:hypothetical protein